MSYNQELRLCAEGAAKPLDCFEQNGVEANLCFKRLHLAAMLCLEDHSGGWFGCVLRWWWPDNGGGLD